LLSHTPEPYRLLLLLLAATGLRVSETIGLQWKHLHLDGSSPHLKIRRAIVGRVVGPPKSRYGRRDVPLPHEVVVDLRRLHKTTEWPRPDDPVFASSAGTPWWPENVRKQIVVFAQEAGVEWTGFHGLRHFYASELIACGRSIVQISRALGHHSASFTLEKYASLMDDGIGGAIDLGGVLPARDQLEAAVEHVLRTEE
jgi:integrase